MLFRSAEAKIIEADPVAHAKRISDNQKTKGVWYPTPRPGAQVDDNADGTGTTAGVATVFARLAEADALEHAAMVEHLAAALAEHADVPDGEEPLGMDHWRAEAFAMLADPAAVLAFLHGINDEDAEPEPSPIPAAEIVVHLAQQADGTLGPLARVEIGRAHV